MSHVCLETSILSSNLAQEGALLKVPNTVAGHLAWFGWLFLGLWERRFWRGGGSMAGVMLSLLLENAARIPPVVRGLTPQGWNASCVQAYFRIKFG